MLDKQLFFLHICYNLTATCLFHEHQLELFLNAFYSLARKRIQQTNNKPQLQKTPMMKH